jgi:hypothetical protein
MAMSTFNTIRITQLN